MEEGKIRRELILSEIDFLMGCFSLPERRRRKGRKRGKLTRPVKEFLKAKPAAFLTKELALLFANSAANICI